MGSLACLVKSYFRSLPVRVRVPSWPLAGFRMGSVWQEEKNSTTDARGPTDQAQGRPIRPRAHPSAQFVPPHALFSASDARRVRPYRANAGRIEAAAGGPEGTPYGGKRQRPVLRMTSQTCKLFETGIVAFSL